VYLLVKVATFNTPLLYTTQISPWDQGFTERMDLQGWEPRVLPYFSKALICGI
jgi:hypothetical protein